MKIQVDKKWNKIIAMILLALFFAIAGGLAWMSGTHSLTHTYNEGEICDVRGIAGYSVTLDPMGSENSFWVYTDQAITKWKYVYINLKDTNFKDAWFEVQGHQKDEFVGQPAIVQLSPGWNEIKLNCTECSSVCIKITGNDKVSFTIQSVELREQKLTFSMSQYLQYVAMLFSGFMILAILVITLFRWKKCYIDWYAPIDFLQDVYISFGNHMLPLSQKIKPKTKHVLRITALVCWMFWIMFTYNIGKYLLSGWFKYNVLLFCIMMFLIAISMLEKPLQKRDWNMPLVHLWFWFSIAMCISEFFICKRFCMIGYVNLTVFGFYYLAWGNMEKTDVVLREIIEAFKIAFLLSFVFTLLARPRNPGFGLTGHTWNPNIYGIFCGIVLLAFLASVRNHLLQRYCNKLRVAIDLVGAMISLSFVLLAGSRAGILLVIPGLIFFLAEYISCLRRKVIGWGKGLLGLVAACAVFGLVHIALAWGTIHLPIVQVVFSWDSDIPNETVKSMIAVGMETPTFQNIMFSETATHFLTGRNLYWAEYLRNINFLGHEYYPSMWGGARTPHNGILGIIYRYGILTAVPYILMFVNVCVIAFREYIRTRQEASMGFYFWICAIGISLCMLIENFERPFLATEWLWWYWCLGFGFICYNRQKSKKEALA